jgi:phage terminase large subunit
VPDDVRPLLVGRTWVDERRRRWGEGSPLWLARVRGKFPDVSDDTLIQPAWIAAAQARDLSGQAIDTAGAYGVDVATTGGDRTVIYHDRAGMLRKAGERRGQDTMATAGQVARLLGDHPAASAAVDVIGVGAGVHDRLSEQGLSVRRFNAAEAAYDRERFVNRRAEAYWSLRESLERGTVDLDPFDDDLAAQLGAIKWKTDSRGRIQIESKADMRKRLGGVSPDHADAAVIAHADARADGGHVIVEGDTYNDGYAIGPDGNLVRIPTPDAFTWAMAGAHGGAMRTEAELIDRPT